MSLALISLIACLQAAPQKQDTAYVQLRVLPSALQLDSARDLQRMIALGVRLDGCVKELGAEVTWSLADPAIAAIEPIEHGVLLRPLHDGDTQLIAQWRESTVRVPLRVRNATTTKRASFRNEILPALTAAGCNTGSCHGAASGKNGFGLSLFGYNPGRDHQTLTRDLRGRRIDFAAPEQSLMLQKATTGAVHQGGKRLAGDDASYLRILDWIREGAVDDGEKSLAVTSIELEPSNAMLIGFDAGLPFTVRAHYEDGTDSDVTKLSLWSSSSDAIGRIDRQGQLTTTGRGEAVILARFHGLAAVARVRVHPDDAAFVFPSVASNNLVDEHIHQVWKEARTLPPLPCTDDVFLRRIQLDLTGLLPLPEQSRAFLDDQSTDKRARLIDALLEQPAFAASQAAMWADVLQVDGQTMEAKGAALLGRHLREAFITHRPFDELVHELLTGNGATFSVPAANFQLIAQQPHLVAEKTAQVFLGVRLQCAQCHNHPFERWSMDDYYGFAAFFGQVGKKRGLDPYEFVIWNRGGGEVRNLKNGVVMPPRLLGAGLAKLPPNTDRRQALADWICDKDNPFFARNVANRLWARMFGRGLVEPVDDVRIGNPPSHPALLDALANILVEAKFDVRAVVKTIALSSTYQACAATVSSDASLFAGMRPRRLAAEPMLDAISMVTGVLTKYPGVPLGSPASAIDAGRNSVRFLDAFGRPARDSVCTCDRRDDPTLGQTLHLINGDTIANKIADGQGRLHKALAAKLAPATALEDLFLAAYCRKPSAGEQERLLSMLQNTPPKDSAAAWQDVYWSVLNSKEFLFQH
ncbi:surface protein [Planctomycetota bacterium]|nr:surface protein [Planctomycetota bacterium]